MKLEHGTSRKAPLPPFQFFFGGREERDRQEEGVDLTTVCTSLLAHLEGADRAYKFAEECGEGGDCGAQSLIGMDGISVGSSETP